MEKERKAGLKSKSEILSPKPKASIIFQCWVVIILSRMANYESRTTGEEVMPEFG